MKVYVAAPLAASQAVQLAQAHRVHAGHELTFDWSQVMSLVEGFETQPEKSARVVTAMVGAVLDADAVLVLATEHEGRGMFVELGSALAQAERGSLCSIAVIGHIHRESVLYLHPKVRRYPRLDWLADAV